MSVAYWLICWPTIGQHTDQHYWPTCQSTLWPILSWLSLDKSANMSTQSWSTDMVTKSQPTYWLSIGWWCQPRGAQKIQTHWSWHSHYSQENKNIKRRNSTLFWLLSWDTRFQRSTHGQNLISRTHGSSGHLEKIPKENNENFTKKCGMSKIICDTASRAIYLSTRLRLRLKGWLI